MNGVSRWLLCLPLGALAASAGCQQWVGGQGRFDACQAQNRSMVEEKRAHLAEIENLKIHARSVEDQLIHAEEELARIDDPNTKRNGLTRSSRGVPTGISGRLADLAGRYPSLQYDAQTGISKLDTDVLFASGDTHLKPAAEKLLTEFAQILQSPEAEQLKIMVVGHTDAQAIKGRDVREKFPDNWHLSAGRALSVAQRLRQGGITDDRIGIAGFGQNQPVSPNDTAEARQKNRRVEIFVVGPDTPVVGWTETIGTLYR